MTFEMFSRVALRVDLPDKKLQKGDIGRIVEYLKSPQDEENGYCLEMFSATGSTIAVIVVRESEIEPLNQNEILHARHLDAMPA